MAAFNYFNFYTEVEEHFQKARGTGLFLLSPLDWALIEGWKNGGIPLEAVLRGIDAAFEKWRARPRKHRQVNSVAYCTQAILDEAQAMAEGGSVRPAANVEVPFTLDEVRGHLVSAAAKLRAQPGFEEVAAAVDRIVADLEVHYADLEQLEQRLTALEEKMAAIARTSTPDERLFEMRRSLELSLQPYRGKMPAEQIAMLERQYLERQILQESGLPRLSLFYLA